MTQLEKEAREHERLAQKYNRSARGSVGSLMHKAREQENKSMAKMTFDTEREKQ